MSVVRTWAGDWAEASAVADEHAGLSASANPFASLGIFPLERQTINFERIVGSRNYRALDRMLLQHVKD